MYVIFFACSLGEVCSHVAKGLFIQRIYRDKPFWEKVSLKLSRVLCEALSAKSNRRKFTFVGAEKFCFCHDIEYGEMAFCDNPTCPIGWFHFSCVGLQFPPTGTWYCSKCDGAL